MFQEACTIGNCQIHSDKLYRYLLRDQNQVVNFQKLELNVVENRLEFMNGYK